MDGTGRERANVSLSQKPRGPGGAVTLDNWQIAPQIAWTFQHLEDLFPTSRIAAGPSPSPLRAVPSGLEELSVSHPGGRVGSVGGVMTETDTDGWIVTRGGDILAEGYPSGMHPDRRHMLMSVSKSLVGSVAGVLSGAGALNLAASVAHYLPAFKCSGYGEAAVQQLLDMRSGVYFSEDYLDPNAEVRLLEQAIGWAPRRHPNVAASMHDFLLSLGRSRPHGGPFEYRSSETDVLGLVCEAAAGQRMATLMSELLWQPIGAQADAVIAVDPQGTGMFDGGICATLRDLVRFGELILRDGANHDGRPVLPSLWVEETLRGATDSREAFAVSPTITMMPGGMYRNQFWFPYPHSEVLLALGIHGQMIYINRPARIVAAKLSHWPEPQHATKLFSTLQAFDAIALQFI